MNPSYHPGHANCRCPKRRESPAEPVVGPELPGVPPPALDRIWGDLSALERSAFLPHLIGSTSAEWLADLLRSHKYQISASTIRTYRRALNAKEVCNCERPGEGTSSKACECGVE